MPGAVKRILVGTSGWAYDDWVGPFYPKALSRQRWLSFYGERFPTVEVNSTHYHFPSASEVAGTAGRVETAGLTDVIYKAPREITHELIVDREAARAREEAERFHDALAPMAEIDRLAGLLYQFSHTAEPDAVLPGIRQVLETDPPAPLFVEVRHAAFNEDRHHEALSDLVEPGGGAVVATDSPASTITRAPPGKAAYFRFHGRNQETWFEKDPPGVHGSGRYDYLYPDDEIVKLADRVEAAEAEVVFVYFNNHVGGQAARNAQQLMELLDIPPPKQRKTLDDFS